jgi:hypothetical protein
LSRDLYERFFLKLLAKRGQSVTGRLDLDLEVSEARFRA